MDVFSDTAGVQVDPRRVARNQATLRTLNEAIDTDRADGVIAFRCECGQLGCNRLIPLRREQYEAVRGNARRFVIAPEHLVPELEHVVERHAEHAVVETHPHTSDFAERTDPRSAGTDGGPGRRPARRGRRRSRCRRARRTVTAGCGFPHGQPCKTPKVRVGFVGQCPDGTFGWGFLRATATQFDPDLESVSVSGTFTNVADNRGGLHTVSVVARWTGTGPTTTTVNGPGSKRKQRAASATATIVFDGDTLVDGAANFPFPAPFIRVDTEK